MTTIPARDLQAGMAVKIAGEWRTVKIVIDDGDDISVHTWDRMSWVFRPRERIEVR